MCVCVEYEMRKELHDMAYDTLAWHHKVATVVAAEEEDDQN